MGIAVVLAAGVALLGGVFYLIYLNEKRWFELSRKAAAELGCAAAPEKEKSFTEEFETHRWQVEDFSVELKTGSLVRLAGTHPVPVTSAAAAISWPRPLPFQFSVNLKRLEEGNAKTGDLDFDGELGVRTSDEAGAARLLQTAELRRELRELFQSARSLPTAIAALDEKSVKIQTFDKNNIKASVLLALSVARRVRDAAAG